MPGAGGASKGHGYSATNEGETRQDAALFGDQGEGGVPGQAKEEQRRKPSLRSSSEQVKGWLQTEQRSTRGVLLSGAAAALLLIWGSYQLGARTRSTVQAQQRASSAMQDEYRAGKSRNSAPGGRADFAPELDPNLLPSPAASTEFPDSESSGRDRSSSLNTESGIKPLQAGASQDWSKEGFLVLTRNAADADSKSMSSAVKNYLLKHGFGKVDWMNDGKGHILVGIRYPAKASPEAKQKLFERFRALPMLKNKVVTMRFNDIKRLDYDRGDEH